MSILKLEMGDRGISSTTGLVLLIAVIVIIGGVIGGAAFAIGSDQTRTGPQATFEIVVNPHDDTLSNSNDELKIHQKSGDTVNVDNLVITIDGTDISELGMTTTNTAGGEITAGESISYTETSNVLRDGVQVSVIWQGPNNETSVELQNREIDK